MDDFKYLFISTIVLSISYLGFLIIFKKETNFALLRFSILSIIIFSVFIPFNTLVVDFAIFNKEYKTQIDSKIKVTSDIKDYNSIFIKPLNEFQNIIHVQNWRLTISYLYIIVVVLLLLRIIISLFIVFHLYLNSDKKRLGKLIIIKNETIRSPFSFFNLIFTSSDNINILSHEKTHANQFHSLDILFIEILSAFMWFNPVVWMMRKRLKLIHEYLADEGALQSGIDEYQYQAAIINQISEAQLINITSTFNTSIKKRIMMITKEKSKHYTKIRSIGFLSLLIILFVFVGQVNGQNSKEVVTAIELEKMNILYVGVDNPIKIASSGFEKSMLQVSIDNGTIKGGSGEYIINVKKPGMTEVTVSVKGKVIQRTKFRVKNKPESGIQIINNTEPKFYSGKTTKKELLHWGGIQFIYKFLNLDLDIPILHYQMIFAPENSSPFFFNSKNTTFSDEQIKRIRKLKKGDRMYFEKIIVLEKDGNPKKAGAVTLVIN